MKARNPSLLYVTTVPYTLRAFLLPYGDHFRAQGWKVAAAASGGAPEEGTITDRTWDMATRAAFHEHYDLDLHRGLRGVPGIYRAGSRLRDLVMHGGFDLVHVHTPIAGVAARMGLRRLRSAGGARVIYTAHGFHFHAGRSRLQNLPWETVERVCARWTDRLVVMNEEDHIAATSWGTIEPNRVVRMPGIGVDLARYGRNRSREAAVDGNIPHDDRVVLMLGELRRNKRVADALMALRRLDGLQITLCIAGEGPELGPLKALARRLEIADQVRFLGFRNDVPTLLARADALVLWDPLESTCRHASLSIL